MNKPQSLSPQSIVLRAGAIAGFVGFSFLIFWSLFSGIRGLVEPYSTIETVLTVIIYLLTIPSFALVVSGRWGGRILPIGVGAISVVVLLILSLVVFGYLQDLAGVRCTDLWKEKSIPCIEVTQFWLRYFIFLPLIYIPTTLVFSVILTYGLIDETRLSRKKRTIHKRR